MKSWLKKLSLTAFALTTLTSSAFADNNAEFRGNWTETFHLKGGHYIVHTPTYVLLDGNMKAGEGILIRARSFNGMPLGPCGLNVNTDSTREEFVAALRCSGLYA